MIQTILFLHILAGVAALAAAGIAVGSAKGGRLHRRSGNIYTLAMLVVGLSALVLAVCTRTRSSSRWGCSASTSSSPAGARRWCATGGPGASTMPAGR
jgi:hypothetical protein